MRYYKLSDIAKVNPASNLPELGPADDVAYIPIAAIDADTHRATPQIVRVDSLYRYSGCKDDAPSLDVKLTQPGDVLLPNIKGSLAKVCIAEPVQDLPVLTIGKIVLIRPMLVDSRYLMAFLCHPDVQESLGKEAGGQAQQSVRTRHLQRLSVPVPGREEQVRIGEKFREVLDAADVMRKAAQAQLAAIDDLRRTIVDKALHGEGLFDA